MKSRVIFSSGLVDLHGCRSAVWLALAGIPYATSGLPRWSRGPSVSGVIGGSYTS